jgi:AcrR family transcriptional regulator
MKLEELYESPAAQGTGPAERAIMRAAIELFGERGYGATSVRKIATAAGVTPPLIAYHYKSKEGLFLACMDVVMRGMNAMSWAAINESQSISQLVRELARVHLNFPKQHPQALRLLMTVFYGPEDSRPAVEMMGEWVSLILEVERRMRNAVDGGEFTPRVGTDSVQLTRQLFRLLHMAVFESCEREKCGSVPDVDPGFLAPAGDPVEDIHDQFFFGAGRLSGTGNQKLEETR